MKRSKNAKRSKRPPQPIGPGKPLFKPLAPPPPERAAGDEELEAWLEARRDLKPWARNLAMIDGFVAAVVCGPVSMHPHAWFNPLLAIEPAAWDVGGTPEFAAIKAVTDRHNAISDTLVADAPYKPVFRIGADGKVDPSDWCEGFMLCVKMHRRKWKDVLDEASQEHKLMLPILLYCKDKRGRPLLGAYPPSPELDALYEVTPGHIPLVVGAMRKYFQLQRFGSPHPNMIARQGSPAASR